MPMVEAKKLAFADRERWAADPRSVEAPLARLLSAEYAAGLAARIDMRRAAPTRITPTAAAGDTTYFCTADGEGNAVSGIQSINSGFGSGVIAGDTGILLNNRMAYWHLDPGHPNRLSSGAPGAPHDEPADRAQGRRVVVRLRHPRRRQPGADQSAGAHGDDRFRARPAAGGRDAALDLERPRPIRQLAA